MTVAAGSLRLARAPMCFSGSFEIAPFMVHKNHQKKLSISRKI
jgi:hypothetical protein